MIVKLIAKQIPEHWEIIKFCLSQVDTTEAEHRQAVAIKMLHDLLNNKAQCFVRVDKDRVITSMLITRLTADKETGELNLWINCVYSFQGANNGTWQDDWGILEDFATREGCKYIYFRTQNKRILALAELMGCEEKYRVFAKRIAA